MHKLKLVAFLSLLSIIATQEVVPEGKGGSPCQSNANCQLYYECKGHEHKKCVHKPLFPHPSARELVGVFLRLIVNAHTNAGGVGAGALIAPFLMLFNNFSPNEAVVMTYPMLFGGGLGAALNFIYRRNPETRMPMVNYNNLLLVVPAFQVGAPIGVLLNRFLAPIVMNILLLTLLGFLSLGMTVKFCKLRWKEQQSKKTQQKIPQIEATSTQNHETASTLPEHKAHNMLGVTQRIGAGKQNLESHHKTQPMHPNEKPFGDAIQLKEGQNNLCANGRCSSRRTTQTELTHNIDLENEPHTGFDEHKAQESETKKPFEVEVKRDEGTKTSNQKFDSRTHTHPEVQSAKLGIEKWQKKERRLLPWEKIFILIFFLITTTVMNLLFGNKKVKSIIGVKFCSGAYWALFFTLIVGQSLCFLGSSFLVLRWGKAKAAAGWDFSREMKINKRRLVIVFFVGALGGVFAGLLAAGGALIMWFLFLQFGVSPLLLLATTAVLLDFTQFTTVLMACLEGNYSAADLISYLFLAAVFSFIVCKIIHRIVKRTRRQSYILANLAILLWLALIINIVAMSLSIRSNRAYMFQFKSFC